MTTVAEESLTTAQRAAIYCITCGQPWLGHPQQTTCYARQPRRCRCGWSGVYGQTRRRGTEPACPECGRLYPQIGTAEILR